MLDLLAEVGQLHIHLQSRHAEQAVLCTCNGSVSLHNVLYCFVYTHEDSTDNALRGSYNVSTDTMCCAMLTSPSSCMQESRGFVTTCKLVHGLQACVGATITVSCDVLLFDV